METKSIAWNDGSGDYISLTYTGQGNGTVVVTSQPNNSANARSATFDIKTTAGSPVVTRGLTVTQGACPVPIGTVLNYAYTGSYQEVELPAGTYKLQCWGAQGGSNGTNSTYGITAKAGGKGGYSEGVLTLTQKTTVRVYVGGQGSSSAGGYNGGGSTTGTSQYNSEGTLGYSKMGGGGGATDIRLSDGALLSRMIVAGGGSGGAMSYRSVTSTEWNSFASGTSDSTFSSSGVHGSAQNISSISAGDIIRIKATVSNTTGMNDVQFRFRNSSDKNIGSINILTNGTYSSEFTAPANTSYIRIYSTISDADAPDNPGTFTYVVEKKISSTTTSTDSYVGCVGGGTSGGGYSTTYQGKQNAAGTGGSFGQGANQTTTNYRYASGAGGGGWYGGGGGQKSDSSMTYVKYSGGGSGWVNVAASAGNRPTGYTGLELNSGETKAGNKSFPSTSGGTETGHSGNGYAKITRLA